MFISITHISQNLANSQKISLLPSELYIKYEIGIQINNNTELAAWASAGNGTVENPYIIENKSEALGLVCPGSSCYPRIGISIKNTDKYFILRKCNYFQSQFILDAKYFSPSSYSGIILENVSNGILVDNSIQGIPNGIANGIYISNSENINISHNSINITYDAIFIADSTNITISHNSLNTNGYGIHLFNSTQNILVDNTLNGNWHAIELTRSSFNLLTNNNGTSNYYAIVLNSQSSHNNITWNTFTVCTFGFKQDTSCINNQLENNIFEAITFKTSMWLVPTLIGIALIGLVTLLKRRKKN